MQKEFYAPFPEGYAKGMTKYIVVFGTVMSGLGKGIFCSSLAKLLEMRKINVVPIKFDGYLNQDAGTLNPYRHGEVFVLRDGTETDMDFGTYERILNAKLDKDNYLTGGKLFQIVLNKEREGEYLGRDVQIIPHVTGEIKYFIRNLAMKRDADVVLIEIGGTVGDFENGYFIEGMREFAYEEGRDNVFFIAMTYVIEPFSLGEQKSKPAQLGLRALLSLGIQPDMLACRSEKYLNENIKEKLSIYSNVKLDNVIGLHDQKSVYAIPLYLKENFVDKKIIEKLNLKADNTNFDKEERELNKYIHDLNTSIKKVTIGITGKYTKISDSYASIVKALEHAGIANNALVHIKWIDTEEFDESKLEDIDGMIVPGGFGSRGVEGKIRCIKYARENKIPFLGICYGFQMALVEFARNVLKLNDAHTTEVNPDTKNPVICLLPEQMDVETKGGTMRLGERGINVKQGSIVHNLYGSTHIKERFRHRYECNPKYIEDFENNGVIFSGNAPEQPIMQILELNTKAHPFFVGVQYHPEFTSKVNKPNPLFYGLINASLKNIE